MIWYQKQSRLLIIPSFKTTATLSEETVRKQICLLQLLKMKVSPVADESFSSLFTPGCKVSAHPGVKELSMHMDKPCPPTWTKPVHAGGQKLMLLSFEREESSIPGLRK